MKNVLACLALLTPLHLAASPQDDRAATIERLSDTYGATATIAAPAPDGGSVIRIDGCDMTFISTGPLSGGTTLIGRTSELDLTQITIGSSRGTGLSYMLTDEGEEWENLGIIPMISAAPIAVKMRGPLPDLLGPDAVLAFPVGRETELDRADYVLNPTTAAEIDRLAQALASYQADYCLPAS